MRTCSDSRCGMLKVYHLLCTRKPCHPGGAKHFMEAKHTFHDAHSHDANHHRPRDGHTEIPNKKLSCPHIASRLAAHAGAQGPSHGRCHSGGVSRGPSHVSNRWRNCGSERGTSQRQVASARRAWGASLRGFARKGRCGERAKALIERATGASVGRKSPCPVCVRAGAT